jgi:hypothetical protein
MNDFGQKVIAYFDGLKYFEPALSQSVSADVNSFHSAGDGKGNCDADLMPSAFKVDGKYWFYEPTRLESEVNYYKASNAGVASEALSTLWSYFENGGGYLSFVPRGSLNAAG